MRELSSSAATASGGIPSLAGFNSVPNSLVKRPGELVFTLVHKQGGVFSSFLALPTVSPVFNWKRITLVA